MKDVLGFQSFPATCAAGTGEFSRRGIRFPEEKIPALQILRPEGFRPQAKSDRGWQWRGKDSPDHLNLLVSFQGCGSVYRGSIRSIIVQEVLFFNADDQSVDPQG
jgi:hypothetical protein